MSLGYSLVKLVLKLKGEKRSWSKDPVDYLQKRKQDVHAPGKQLLLGSQFDTKEIGTSIVTRIHPKEVRTDFLLIYCHGGAFVYGPTKENWIALAKIAKQAHINAWMVDYPKAPENTIDVITDSVYRVYQEATKAYEPSKIVLIGDSVGGNLILTLTQRLQIEKKEVPNRLIAITPVVDGSLTNAKIAEIDPIDPVLSLKGVKSAKLMCAGKLPLTDPLMSPIYGNLEGLPPIHIFIATNDILTPDQELFVEKLEQEGGDIEVIIGENMPHVWPIFPIMPEAKSGLQKIVSILNSAVKS